MSTTRGVTVFVVPENMFSKAEQVAAENKVDINEFVGLAIDHYSIHQREIKLWSQEQQYWERQLKLSWRYGLSFLSLMAIAMALMIILPDKMIGETWIGGVLLGPCFIGLFGSMFSFYVWGVASIKLDHIYRQRRAF